MPLWHAEQPLVLASRSKARHTLLTAAGIPVEICAADLDERSLEETAESPSPGAIAAHLARSKAAVVAARRPGRLTLGADQTLALGSERFVKPSNLAEARTQLHALCGRTHELHSAVAVMQDAKALFEHVEVAQLTMRTFSDRFLDIYLAVVGNDATESVGAYQIEGPGLQLFERVDGDYFTILGLPLLPVLEFFRRQGSLIL